MARARKQMCLLSIPDRLMLRKERLKPQLSLGASKDLSEGIIAVFNFWQFAICFQMRGTFESKQST
eukprot:3877978-Pleurochrysis_carterae.AAC.1